MNNSTNNRWLTVITLLLLTANIVTLALLWSHKKGGNGPQPPQPGGGEVFEFITHELNLDSAQQVAYKKLREEHQAGQRPLQDSIRKAKDDFFELLKQANVTDSLIRGRNKKIGDLEQELNLRTYLHFQKLRAICTADQQKKFDSIIQEVLKRFAPPRRQGPPPPGMEGERPGGDRMPPPPGMGEDDKRPPNP